MLYSYSKIDFYHIVYLAERFSVRIIIEGAPMKKVVLTLKPSIMYPIFYHVGTHVIISRCKFTDV